MFAYVNSDSWWSFDPTMMVNDGWWWLILCFMVVHDGEYWYFSCWWWIMMVSELMLHNGETMVCNGRSSWSIMVHNDNTTVDSPTLDQWLLMVNDGSSTVNAAQAMLNQWLMLVHPPRISLTTVSTATMWSSTCVSPCPAAVWCSVKVWLRGQQKRTGPKSFGGSISSH